MTIGLVRLLFVHRHRNAAVRHHDREQVREAFEEVRSGGAALLLEQAARRQGCGSWCQQRRRNPVVAGDAVTVSEARDFLGCCGIEGKAPRQKRITTKKGH
ncbi:MAG: hypothetical protein ACLTQI_09260 [Slackia sp.]